MANKPSAKLASKVAIVTGASRGIGKEQAPPLSRPKEEKVSVLSWSRPPRRAKFAACKTQPVGRYQRSFGENGRLERVAIDRLRRYV
jgi:NAD(P)-dependent dehydrogenase (short-subunit alcohol dehydrogenase family)